MKKMHVLVCLFTGAVSLSSGSILAADQDRTQTRMETKQQIYGSQMMTEQERNEYRTKMRNASSAQEREQIRAEHHERMKERAKARGITLPDMPPARGGMGQGMGGGMRKGGGGM